MKETVFNKIMEIESELSKYKGGKISLLGGTTGIAIFYAHLYDLTGDTKFLDQCTSLIVHTLRKLRRVELNYTFCEGVSGIAWGINYLMKKNIFEYDSDIFEEVDDYIYESANNDLIFGNYDYLHGAMGAVMYALERLDTEKALLFLQSFIEGISRIKQEDKFGYKWVDPSFIKRKYKYNYINAYNLGLAHGIPSIVEILRKIYLKNICIKEVSDLLKGGVSWIENCKLNDPDAYSVYPSCVFDSVGTFDGSSRMAWCYGDLTLALMFWNCGETFGNESWKLEGLKLMRHSIKRQKHSVTKLDEACFCHGSVGIAHLFKKFHILTHDPEFDLCSNLWINDTLAQARHKGGLAGFKALSRTEKNNIVYNRWSKKYDLLEGVAGVGLGLITHLNNKTEWDTCLLL